MKVLPNGCGTLGRIHYILWIFLTTTQVTLGKFYGKVLKTILFSISNDNQFSWRHISYLFCSLGEIGFLDLSNNSLSGNMPLCFGNFSGIYVLDLRMNYYFHVMIPYQHLQKETAWQILTPMEISWNGHCPDLCSIVKRLKF